MKKQSAEDGESFIDKLIVFLFILIGILLYIHFYYNSCLNSHLNVGYTLEESERICKKLIDR